MLSPSKESGGLELRIGCFQYDHTRALFDGSFEGAGIVSEIFERLVRQRAFDVSELLTCEDIFVPELLDT